jgi:drug/metabolite transporter (DMT)-like permease
VLKGARQPRRPSIQMLPSTRLVGLLCALAAPLCWSVGGLVFRSVEAGPFESIVWRSLGHVLVFPIFLLVAILGWVVLRERVGTRGWLALACAFTGLAIVVGSSIGSGSFLGNAFALGVAACSACMVILTRRARAVSMQPVTIIGAALAVLIALPFGAPVDIPASDIALLLSLGLIQMTLGLSFFLYALRLMPAAQVTLIALLEPVLGPVWVWLFKGEEPSHSTILGGAIILTALAANMVLGLRFGARQAAQPA